MYCLPAAIFSIGTGVSTHHSDGDGTEYTMQDIMDGDGMTGPGMVHGDPDGMATIMPGIPDMAVGTEFMEGFMLLISVGHTVLRPCIQPCIVADTIIIIAGRSPQELPPASHAVLRLAVRVATTAVHIHPMAVGTRTGTIPGRWLKVNGTAGRPCAVPVGRPTPTHGLLKARGLPTTVPAVHVDATATPMPHPHQPIGEVRAQRHPVEHTEVQGLPHAVQEAVHHAAATVQAVHHAVQATVTHEAVAGESKTETAVAIYPYHHTLYIQHHTRQTI